MSRELKEVPYKGKFGEIIHPGDKIGFLTVGRRQPNLARGVYLGLVNESARVLEHYTTTTFHDPETDEDLTSWKSQSAWLEPKIGKQPAYPSFYTKWPAKNDNFSADKKTYNEYQEKLAALLKTRVERLHPAKRIRTLRKNIMFKLEF